MPQNYTIYINDYSLLITEQTNQTTEKYQQISALDFDIVSFYKTIKKQTNKHFFILTEDAKSLFKSIKKKLTIVKAAGGLVENAKGDFLFIFRHKKWDLPKGKWEKGEKMKETAVREVEEECGITVMQREELLCKTYHIYEMGGEIVLKRTNWYKMKVKGSPKLIPQEAEDISEAVWVSQEGIKEKMKNTYPLIKDVLKNYVP